MTEEQCLFFRFRLSPKRRVYCGLEILEVHVRNVTITLPEDVARWLRVKAAQNESSVSRWIAELLEGIQRQEDEYEIAMERFLARAREPRKIEWVDGRKPTREELHDRAGLR